MGESILSAFISLTGDKSQEFQSFTTPFTNAVAITLTDKPSVAVE